MAYFGAVAAHWVFFSVQIADFATENAELKQKLKHIDSLEREKQELERQLNSTRDNLFSEQKQNRGKLESLQEVFLQINYLFGNCEPQVFHCLIFELDM